MTPSPDRPRIGVTILPELRWRDAEPRWRAAEEMGFAHLWTYDHLTWSGLPDSPWFGTVSTLTAAALVTERVGIGTFVASPNYRHPGAFVRDVLALDDMSDGRLLLGIGTGGDLDSRTLGGPELGIRERVDRFEEFARLLDRLLREDHVDHRGTYFTCEDVRTLPVPQTRPALVMAGNGPRSQRLAVELGDAWATTGRHGDDLAAWWRSLAELASRMDDLGPREGFRRYVHVDPAARFSLSSAAWFDEVAGRCGELGYTDLVTHWPRPDGPYAGDVAVLEEVAQRHCQG
ncbi:LLM class flavin-dependent oxidoreductase [Arsenicicoccus sp. oral taxon 190]|uniref:LLM class flavin-dependent oxidoreductase n=1 Tax=Arsenicicoccus sp. oral taxon 190 TaxID=1658671 RepID=UPI00067A25A1|nr:LLM class flavin-dependent oxidoreductase [Arsenicicoccus sp. oral taxon 190]AKT50353.1 luciferase [Arsenicicoccus sp. oral taxon 190]